MRSRTISGRALALLTLGALTLGSVAVFDDVHAAEKSYQVTVLSGRLSYPESGEPMAGATLRFTPIDPDARMLEATTTADGRFRIEGLEFTNYVVEIVTPEGEEIRGVNVLTPPGEKAEVILKISGRVSETTLENQPDYFAAVVQVEPIKWKRFWKQFAIFFGAAAVTGAVAED